MGIIKGQHLRITIGGKYVAFSTSCTVHVSNSLEDSSTKDTTDGMWAQQSLVGKSWDISVDALYSVDNDQTGINGQQALDLVLANAEVDIEFTGTSGEKNRVASGVKYAGTAFVNDVSLTAGNRENASYSLQATGTGALAKVTTQNAPINQSGTEGGDNGHVEEPGIQQ